MVLPVVATDRINEVRRYKIIRAGLIMMRDDRRQGSPNRSEMSGVGFISGR